MSYCFIDLSFLFLIDFDRGIDTKEFATLLKDNFINGRKGLVILTLLIIGKVNSPILILYSF